jgi:hypothetical protein
MKINKKVSLYSICLKTVKRQEAESQVLHPAQANLEQFIQ